MQRTFYDVLGVSPNATQSVIKAAFRKKAQLVHPDKIQAQIANLDPYAAERLKKALEEDFRDLKEAYDVLSNARQRKEYDDLLKQIQATSAPPPFTPPPSKAPPPRSAPPPANFCTTCGAPLMGSRCTACAKRQVNNARFNGLLAVSWVLGSILAFSIAITLPTESSWDADTCIGILIVLGVILVLAIWNGLWGGIKRLWKTHSKMGALTIEVALLVVLSLVVGASNPPPKAASTQSQTRAPSLIPATAPSFNPETTPDVKLAVPKVKPVVKLIPKKSAVQSLTGQFSGIVINETAGLSAGFGIAVRSTEGALSGCIVVKQPLFGSGPLSGFTRGSNVSFVVTSSVGEITFVGRYENNAFNGTYTVWHQSGTPDEEGTFTLQQTSPEGPGPDFDPASCPTDQYEKTIVPPRDQRVESPERNPKISWKNLKDGQIYTTQMIGEKLRLESVESYPSIAADIISCDFTRAVSIGISWVGSCVERNPIDRSASRSDEYITFFSNTRIEGRKFVLVPVK